MCGIVLVGFLAVAGVGPVATASPGDASPRAAAAPSAAQPWRCSWAPTMDDNWHNDALCSNGVRQVRPHLRPQDSYITRGELMSSARAWAQARNAGR